MLLRPCPIDGNRFTWTGTVGVAEASNFRGYKFGRVYNDACDEGFTVTSSRTGRSIVVARDHEIRDNENELIAEVYISVTPGFKNKFEIHLLND